MERLFARAGQEGPCRRFLQRSHSLSCSLSLSLSISIYLNLFLSPTPNPPKSLPPSRPAPSHSNPGGTGSGALSHSCWQHSYPPPRSHLSSPPPHDAMLAGAAYRFSDAPPQHQAVSVRAFVFIHTTHTAGTRHSARARVHTHTHTHTHTGHAHWQHLRASGMGAVGRNRAWPAGPCLPQPTHPLPFPCCESDRDTYQWALTSDQGFSACTALPPLKASVSVQAVCKASMGVRGVRGASSDARGVK